ncbi:hypothetical protein EON67_09110 [archaeon]|nr:MAG: hypothetical protein EON67_09110 [archaeon]
MRAPPVFVWTRARARASATADTAPRLSPPSPANARFSSRVPAIADCTPACPPAHTHSHDCRPPAHTPPSSCLRAPTRTLRVQSEDSATRV